MISSYDKATDEPILRRKSADAAYFAMEAALTELKMHAEELNNIDQAFFESQRDQEDTEYLISFLRDKASRIEDCNSRYHYFKAELKECEGEE